VNTDVLSSYFAIPPSFKGFNGKVMILMMLKCINIDEDIR
jgi:hypothetical protein